MTNDKLRMTPITTTQPWEAALAGLPGAHPLQSWAWGDFKSRWGWSAERLLWLDSETPAAAAQLLTRRIPRTPWHFLYAAKGPALNWADSARVGRVLADLELYTRRRGALFLKIDPDVPLFTGDPTENPVPDATGQAVQAVLQRRGWVFSPEQIQFRNTVVVPLDGAPEGWLARMKSKWRYNIRYARRNGVEIRPGGPDDIATFYQMYAETAARDGFLIRPQAYYHDVWSHFLAGGQADMLLALVAGQIVAGLILFYSGARAWYLYGASTGAHRKRMPNHLLQFAAMQRAAERGCTHYDLWGAPDVFDESDSMWGVYRFKQGFGGQTVQGLGAYDFPARPAFYRLFTQAMPRARALLRKFAR